jgi:hypothetical protein
MTEQFSNTALAPGGFSVLLAEAAPGAMSGNGTTRTNERAQSMSASAPKAAIVKLPWHFREVPAADSTEEPILRLADYGPLTCVLAFAAGAKQCAFDRLVFGRSVHGADAPRIAEEILERMHREYSARSSGIEESDIETWRTIRDAAGEWLRTLSSGASG